MASDILPKFHALVYRELIEQEKVPTCLTCANREGMYCTLYEANPPAETIVYGCLSWEPEIPF